MRCMHFTYKGSTNRVKLRIEQSPEVINPLIRLGLELTLNAKGSIIIA